VKGQVQEGKNKTQEQKRFSRINLSSYSSQGRVSKSERRLSSSVLRSVYSSEGPVQVNESSVSFLSNKPGIGISSSSFILYSLLPSKERFFK